jgi:hypothetical protein
VIQECHCYEPPVPLRSLSGLRHVSPTLIADSQRDLSCIVSVRLATLPSLASSKAVNRLSSFCIRRTGIGTEVDLLDICVGAVPLDDGVASVRIKVCREPFERVASIGCFE